MRRAARRYNLLDPATVLARIRQFAQPSEVELPLEILRAWVVFQSRGVINTRAIQHNLDWVWPYWIERQFNPRDPSFIPRSYSLTHINLTHRNWTAVGLPGLPLYPVVDPRGLVTPLEDGWSLDFWILREDGRHLLPSREETATQQQTVGEDLSVETKTGDTERSLATITRLVRDSSGEPVLEVNVAGESSEAAHLVVALRPYNTEGVQFVDRIGPLPETEGWLVNDHGTMHARVELSAQPERYAASNYAEGDVFRTWWRTEPDRQHPCNVGMITAGAFYRLNAGEKTQLTVRIPLGEERTRVLKNTPKRFQGTDEKAASWGEVSAQTAKLEIPDRRITDVYNAAATTLLLLSPGDIFPGPCVYKRFWFRDAAMISNALLGINHADRVLRTMESFPERQKNDGFYESQEGEWDSNGAVVWAASRYASVTGKPLPEALLVSLEKGTDWILRKRKPLDADPVHGGMLPAGFSAEHLGPNDYYFWDNFWGIAGLYGFAKILEKGGRDEDAQRYRAAAEAYEKRIWEIIEAIPERRAQGAVPAAPRRRLDAGAIGSIVADYPARLTEPGNPRILRTVEFLLENCTVEHGFFQDMTHSGINVYLTLHLAQILLRAGDRRFRALYEDAVKRASPTGHWPEAVHPIAAGGCMGDGQHAWAAADFVMMTRSLFLREEEDHLVVGEGLFQEWLESGEELSFGPTPTAWGPVTVRVGGTGENREIKVEGDWHGEAPRIEKRVPSGREVSP